jgi:hypothetical protein
VVKKVVFTFGYADIEILWSLVAAATLKILEGDVSFEKRTKEHTKNSPTSKSFLFIRKAELFPLQVLLLFAFTVTLLKSSSQSRPTLYYTGATAKIITIIENDRR